MHTAASCNRLVSIGPRLLQTLLYFATSETNITVGHRTFSERICHVIDRAAAHSVKMAGRKRPAGRSSERSLFRFILVLALVLAVLARTLTMIRQEERRPSVKYVSVTTFEKWQRNFNSECETLTWLRCDTKKEDGPCCSSVVFSLQRVRS